MVSFGFLASLEMFSPSACLEQSVAAEGAGFDRIWPVDHFHPWFDHFEDGTSAHAGNCWTWMPAALERTERVPVGPGVTGILHRHHPATIAHRLATLQVIFPDRVFLGIGCGEGVNEVPLGHPWPDYSERAKRTAEAIRIIRRLYTEDYVDHDGPFWSLDGAHLYTRPEASPPIHVAASGPTSARLAGDLGDGLVVPSTDPGGTAEELFPAVERGIEKSARNASIDDLEKTVLVHCSYAETERAALEACAPWRVMLVESKRGVGDPRALQAEAESIPMERLRDLVLPVTEPADLVEFATECERAGFDHVLVQSSSPDQAAFLELMAEAVIPEFR